MLINQVARSTSLLRFFSVMHSSWFLLFRKCPDEKVENNITKTSRFYIEEHKVRHCVFSNLLFSKSETRLPNRMGRFLFAVIVRPSIITIC